VAAFAGLLGSTASLLGHQVEEYEILEGRFDVLVDGTWRTLGPGERASVPIGALHTFRNRSGELVRVRNWHRPAMRFEAFTERTCTTLSAAGATRKRDLRIAIYLSKMMLDFDETLAPGRTRERLPMQALARIARLLLARRPRGGRAPIWERTRASSLSQ
jgi:hypothetical protein